MVKIVTVNFRLPVGLYPHVFIVSNSVKAALLTLPGCRSFIIGR